MKYPVQMPALVGPDARQMGAAPRTPRPAAEAQPQQTAPPAAHAVETAAPAVNRFDSLFTALVFKASDSNKIYPNERSGSRSKKIANVLIEIDGKGVFTKGSIYARQGPNDKKPHAEFTFFGANMQSCIVAEDQQVIAELNLWKSAVARKYALWLRENPAAAAALGETAVELEGMSLL